MKKRTYAIISATTLLALGGALALSHADKIESLLFRNGPSKTPNTFVIDDDTDFTQAGVDEDDEPIYQGVAISDENSLTTMFSGFELDDGKLGIGQFGVGFFMNTDAMNRGFNGVYTKFSGSGEFNFNIMLYFSYFELDPIEILTGNYGDLQTIGSVHTTANQLAENNFTSIDLPGMEACRYVLGVVFSTDGATLEEIRFSTPCIETVPEVTPSRFEDYRQSDKAIMQEKLGEVMPFFGFGGYHINSDGEIYGTYFMEELAGPFIDATFNAGFEISYEDYPDSPSGIAHMVIQKKVKVAGEDEIHTMVVEYCPFLYSFKVQLTTDMDLIGAYDTWPVALFNEVFNYDDFADDIIANPFSQEGITFVARRYDSGSDNNAIQLRLEGYDNETEEARALLAYLKAFAANNDDWSVYGVPYELPEGEDIYSGYEYEICNGPYRIVLRYTERDGAVIQFREPKLLDTFPTEQINNKLGLTGSDSIIPYTGTGKFKIYSDSSYVYVYLSDVDNARAYAQTLINAGFRLAENYSSEYVLVNDIFDSYTVRIYLNSLEYDGYFSINYDRSVYGNEFDSFQAALEAFTSESLARNHVYPELSGDHIYKTITTNYSYQAFAKGIYISGLTSSYLDSLIGSAEYNAYYDAYQFEDDGNGNYLFISVEEVSGGVRINPFVVSSPVTLYDSVDANALLLARYEAQYPEGNPNREDALASRVDLPNSNGEKVYSVSTYSTSVSIFGNNSYALAKQYFTAIGNNGYDVSELEKHFIYGSTGFYGNWSETDNSYNGVYSTFNFNYSTSPSALRDFVSHDDANLTTLEAAFAEFPHNGAEKIFYNNNDNYVITKDTFDDVAFSNALIANGFERHDNTDSYYFTKDDGTSYYRVEHVSNYAGFGVMKEDGYHIYYFQVENSHYVTFNDVLTKASENRNPVPTVIVNALPNYNALGAVFSYSSSDAEGLWARFSSQMDLQAFAQATIAAGFKKDGSSNFTLVSEENYYITIYVNTTYDEINIRYHDFQWTTVPNPVDYANTLLYRLQNDVLLPDDSGNVFYINRAYNRGNSNSWVEFYLKPSLVNIENYVDKLLNNGFHLTGNGNDYWYFEKTIQGETLYVSINLDYGVYRVYSSYYNNDYIYQVNSADIEGTLAADGWNVSFTDSNVIFQLKEWSYSIYGTPIQLTINYSFGSSSDCNTFANAMIATGDYDEHTGGTHWLEKTEGGHRYVIYIYETTMTMYIYQAA